MKKLKQFFKSRFGEGYVDVAVTILIVAFVLVFAVNVVSLVALNQNMKTAADQIAEYASMNGTTNIDEYVNEQREKIGVQFTCTFDGSESFDGSGRVQLGDKIRCTLTYRLSFMGFGDAIHLATISASGSGISEVYWK